MVRILPSLLRAGRLLLSHIPGHPEANIHSGGFIIPPTGKSQIHPLMILPTGPFDHMEPGGGFLHGVRHHSVRPIRSSEAIMNPFFHITCKPLNLEWPHCTLLYRCRPGNAAGPANESRYEARTRGRKDELSSPAIFK